MAEGERALIEAVNCGHPEHLVLDSLVKHRGVCLTCGLAALAAAHAAGRQAVVDEVLTMIDPLPFCRGLKPRVEALRATPAREEGEG